MTVVYPARKIGDGAIIGANSLIAEDLEQVTDEFMRPLEGKQVR